MHAVTHSNAQLVRKGKRWRWNDGLKKKQTERARASAKAKEGGVEEKAGRMAQLSDSSARDWWREKV